MYNREQLLRMNDSVNPRTLVPLLGQAARDVNRDEWEKDRIILNVDGEFIISHKKVQMQRNPVTGVLEGQLTL